MTNYYNKNRETKRNRKHEKREGPVKGVTAATSDEEDISNLFIETAAKLREVWVSSERGGADLHLWLMILMGELAVVLDFLYEGEALRRNAVQVLADFLEVREENASLRGAVDRSTDPEQELFAKIVELVSGPDFEICRLEEGRRSLKRLASAHANQLVDASGDHLSVATDFVSIAKSLVDRFSENITDDMAILSEKLGYRSGPIVRN